MDEVDEDIPTNHVRVSRKGKTACASPFFVVKAPNPNSCLSGTVLIIRVTFFQSSSFRSQLTACLFFRSMSNPKCAQCGKTVYVTEKLDVLGKGMSTQL